MERKRRSLLDYMRSLDFYPKTQEDALQRTYGGGMATLLAALFLGYLMFSETRDYLQPGTRQYIDVDQSPLEEKISIEFDISFLRLPCANVHVDAVDQEGSTSSADVQLKVQQFRIMDDGKTQEEKSPNYCGDCYGLLTDSDREEALNAIEANHPGALFPMDDIKGMALKCCNSCDILRLLWNRRKGVYEPFVLANVEQCTEGCRLQGEIVVPRRKGNFHFAAGKSQDSGHGGHSHHVHRLNSKDLQNFNTSHHIRRLTFGGEYPGKIEPLAGQIVIEKENLAQYVYYINVVPTTWLSTFQNQLSRAHQYSYYLNRKEVNLKSGHFPLPGIFFKFEIDAVHMSYFEESKPFGPFITRLCGILGGFWVVIGCTVQLWNFLASLRKQQ